MEEISLGKILVRFRKELKITRETLCEGICSVSALTRYENDERVADKLMIDCLLARMGKSAAKIEFIASDEEFNMSMYREEIDTLIKDAKFTVASEKIKEYKKLIKSTDRLQWQYIYLKEGIVLQKSNKYEEAFSLFEMGLSYTKRVDIVRDGIGNKLLSDMELELVYNLAESYFYMQREEKGYFIYSELKNYLKGLSTKNEKQIEHLPYVLYRISQIEVSKLNYGIAYDYLTEAEAIMIREFRFNWLAEIIELRMDVQSKLQSDYDVDEDIRRLMAIKLVKMRENDEVLSDKGIELWENIVNQQL